MGGRRHGTACTPPGVRTNSMHPELFYTRSEWSEFAQWQKAEPQSPLLVSAPFRHLLLEEGESDLFRGWNADEWAELSMRFVTLWPHSSAGELDLLYMIALKIAAAVARRERHLWDLESRRHGPPAAG